MSFEQRCSDFFDSADTDNTGYLNQLELAKVVSNSGCKKDAREIIEWFDDLDKNDDDKISKQEFLKALGKVPPKDVKEADLRAAFKQFDLDGSGSITLDELKQVLVNNGEDPENAALDMDANDDGKVQFEEFLAAWRNM
ncbi:16 kDa calcium-binding protein-like [Littorina saxatilis]|uniref:EF-hand domain-containing protein n=1 Tax=Littorina saxatilis TaxID=31220 RepID=A0AAN9BQJ2_9CAEN